MARLTGDVLVTLARCNQQLPIKERVLVVGIAQSGHAVSQTLSASYLIGGMPNMGKTTIAAWLSCMAVITGGKLLVIDPHCNEQEESLFSKIEPLLPWFACDPVDFEDIDEVISRFIWLEQEYKERKRRSGMNGKTPLFVIIDEFNEFLSELSKDDEKLVVRVLSNIIRGGRKHGIFAVLIAQNWDLSSAGGRKIRTNIGGRIATYCDPLGLFRK